MKSCLIIFFIKVLWMCKISCANENISRIQIPLGKIKGLYKISYEGRRYESYEGIPYALPPTEERRFQPPQAYQYWDHEIDATKRPNNCTQVDMQNVMIVGDEDCLYLNIYTPRQHGISPLPVIFWIHGGAYQWGAGTERRAKYLMDRNVILVTFNYRLGAYGFLSTGDEVIPGNMGLKDQSMALRWVSENIPYFGGDPKRITLAGDSVGAASVQFHYLTPLSAGLFRNGISFSGTALAKWAFTDDGSAAMKIFANATNCSNESSNSFLECLKHRSASEIRNSLDKLLKSQYNILRINITVYLPVVEKIQHNYFFNRSPLEILESGKIYDVPWITGVVSEEGLYNIAEFVLDEKIMSYINTNWESLAPYMVGYINIIPKNKQAMVANLTRIHYLGNKSFGKDSIREFTYLSGDSQNVAYSEKAAKLQAKANLSPVYYYYYSYRAAQSYSDFLTKTTRNLGVCHTDDIFLILENDFIDPTTKAKDRAMLKDMLNFWYSIVNTGKPNLKVDWPKVHYSSNDLEYLHIAGPNNFTLRSTNNIGEKKFWKRIGLDV